MKRYYSHGKLLLTGEYAVLDGALALGLPTHFGQSLEVQESGEKGIQWTSFDIHGNPWFECNYKVTPAPPGSDRMAIMHFAWLTPPSGTYKEIAESLMQLLAHACVLNPDFVQQLEGIEVKTYLEFERSWGLGSSSTLIHNIAQWAGVDPYELLEKTMGGSGYDIACAAAEGPILYQLVNGNPTITRVDFDPSFKDEICFVYLGQKQKSHEAIEHYRKLESDKSPLIDMLSALTKEFLNCTALKDFELLLEQHEKILSEILQLPRVQEQFPDYPGALKSLGAWGGDFILATRSENAKEYFKKKGLTPVIPFSEMIL